MEQTEKLLKAIISGIQEKKGSKTIIIHLEGQEGAVCQKFVICQGSSPQQVEAIERSVEDVARIEAREKPVHVVGLGRSEWVAMDFTDVMVHIFVPQLRAYYDLEHLFEDAPMDEIEDLD